MFTFILKKNKKKCICGNMHIQNMGFDHLGQYMAIVISALQGASGHNITVNVHLVFSFIIRCFHVNAVVQ